MVAGDEKHHKTLQTRFVNNRAVEVQTVTQLEMWANAQPDGRPVEYR